MASSGFPSSRRSLELRSRQGEAGLKPAHPSKPASGSHPRTPHGTWQGRDERWGGREAPWAPKARIARSRWAHSFPSGASVPTSPTRPRGGLPLGPGSTQLVQLNQEGTGLESGTVPWSFFKGSSLWQQSASFLPLSPASETPELASDGNSCCELSAC